MTHNAYGYESYMQRSRPLRRRYVTRLRWIAALQLLCAVIMLLFFILTVAMHLLANRDEELTELHRAYPQARYLVGSVDVITHHALAALVVVTVRLNIT